MAGDTLTHLFTSTVYFGLDSVCGMKGLSISACSCLKVVCVKICAGHCRAARFYLQRMWKRVYKIHKIHIHL